MPIPTDIVAHPDYDIEGDLVNHGIEASKSKIEPMEEILIIDDPKIK